MLLSRKLPIIQKSKLLYKGHIKPLSNYHTLCLSFIIPHGSTDMWIFPMKKYAFNYGSSAALFMFQPMRIKFLFLFLYSFFHIKNDIQASLPIQLVYSSAIHLSWACFPEWALTYLAWIHTSLHYYKVVPFLSKLQLCTLFVTHIFTYILLKKYETDDLSLGGSWIPIVIGHIMTNS